MRKSTIAKHAVIGQEASFAERLGKEIRRRRTASGLTQAQLGDPLSKSFVSAVEHGRIVPSLGALFLLAGRLGIGPAAMLAVVDAQLPAVYSPAHADYSPPRRGGRSIAR